MPPLLYNEHIRYSFLLVNLPGFLLGNAILLWFLYKSIKGTISFVIVTCPALEKLILKVYDTVALVVNKKESQRKMVTLQVKRDIEVSINRKFTFLHSILEKGFLFFFLTTRSICLNYYKKWHRCLPTKYQWRLVQSSYLWFQSIADNIFYVLRHHLWPNWILYYITRF